MIGIDQSLSVTVAEQDHDTAAERRSDKTEDKPSPRTEKKPRYLFDKLTGNEGYDDLYHTEKHHDDSREHGVPVLKLKDRLTHIIARAECLSDPRVDKDRNDDPDNHDRADYLYCPYTGDRFFITRSVSQTVSPPTMTPAF